MKRPASLNYAQPERLYTPAQLAEHLSLSIWCVREKLKGPNPQIASIKLGRQRRVPESALVEFLNKGVYREVAK